MLYQIVSGSEKTATSGRMERVRSIELPILSLAIIAIRSTGVDFIANFPEIHPIFPANSRSKSKLLTFRKLIRECSKLSFARGLFVSATAPELRHISRLAEPHFAVERISLIGLPSMKMVFARSSSRRDSNEARDFTPSDAYSRARFSPPSSPAIAG